MPPNNFESTPRAEAIIKAGHGETTIRKPEVENDTENKIDHSAVLSQVINSGIDRYLSDSEYHLLLQETHSIRHLDANLKFDLRQVILATLKDASFSAHHHSLIESTQARQELQDDSWSSVDAEIKGGVDTYVDAASRIFDFFKSRFGVEEAIHENNWRLLDKLAKLNVDQFAPYRTTYLVIHQNFSHFREQVKENEDGGFRFLPGFPLNAPVTKASLVSNKGLRNSTEFILNEQNETILLKDIPLRKVTTGCPITFKRDTVIKLWDVYRAQAYRLATQSGISVGGIEALHQ